MVFFLILESGKHQDDPLSPLLFAITMGPLANSIKQNNKITGLKIGSHEHKISLYANNVSLYADNLSEIEGFLTTL